MQPGLVWSKRTDAILSWRHQDAIAENSANAMDKSMNVNLANAEVVTAIADSLSTGYKMRTTIADNASGGNFAYMTVAAFPFRYANAR